MKGKTETIPASQAQVGDILLVRPGDRIPLDGVVTKGESRIDTSPVTGEPVPVKVTEGSPVTSGCVNTSGRAGPCGRKKPLAESMVTRILDSAWKTLPPASPRSTGSLPGSARVYTPVVVGIGSGHRHSALPLRPATGSYWIYTALTFLVISCPCALVLSVPLAFFAGIGAGSKQGILFKGGVLSGSHGNCQGRGDGQNRYHHQGQLLFCSRLIPWKEWIPRQVLDSGRHL